MMIDDGLNAQDRSPKMQTRPRWLVLYFCPVIVLLSSHMVFTRIRAYDIQHFDSMMHFVGGIALGIWILGMFQLAQRLRLFGQISQKQGQAIL